MANTLERALILDEADPNILFWELALKDAGVVEVVTARTGAEAVQIFGKSTVNLVVAAWELSSMPGTVFIQQIRASNKRKHLPCIIYSKNMKPEEVQLTRELGLENIVSMPFDKPKIKEMITQIIEQENNPSKQEKSIRKIEFYINDGKPMEAFKLVDATLMTPGPNLKRAKILVGEIMLLIGKKDDAEKSFKEACDLDPAYVPAKQALARFYSLTGKHDEAIGMLNQLSQQCPMNFSTIINLSSAYINADQTEKAKQVLHQITAIDPDNKQVDDELGKIAVKEGNLPLAAKLLSETQNGDEIARFYNSMGISLVAKGQFENGIETYRSALQVLATKAKTHLILYNLGLALKKKGDLAGGFKSFCESYIAEPTFEKAYSSIAKTAQELKEKNLNLDMTLVQKVKSARASLSADLLSKLKGHREAS